MSDYFTSASPTPFGAALQRCETLSESLDNISGLADVLISQNVYLIKRIHELEEHLYKLESGAANNGILRQQQGHNDGQPLYNSLFSPAVSSFTNPIQNNSDSRQQQMVAPPIPLLTSFNFLTLGQRGSMESTTIEQH